MKMILVFLFFLFNSFVGYAQQDPAEEEIKKFVFKTFSRGYSKTMEVSPDSVIILEDSRSRGEREVRREAREGEWENMLKAVSAYKLSDLRDLPAPTQHRTFDGARHSNIIIITNKQEYDSGSFDDENPNRKLEELMQAFIELEEEKTKEKPLKRPH